MLTLNKKQNQGKIAFIGNYLPRQCGIATFTTDLCEAVSGRFKNVDCFTVALTDGHNKYQYPSRVRFEIPEQNLLSYSRAADFINAEGASAVSLQHEYGIFGGPSGIHILTLLSKLNMPVFTTLHTVLENPTPLQRSILEAIARLSSRLIVMSRHSMECLQQRYKIPAEKIAFIPHGIPDVPFADPNQYKKQFNLEKKTVLLTFGLLSSNKGIENVIEALPAIVSRYPDVIYLVVGATHPHVVRSEGESYREGLKKFAAGLGVSKHVAFHQDFVTLEQLKQFIGAADIYVTPYLNPNQTVSGTLAYTVGAGKAIVSTPYWYAEELLANGRGVIVPFRDSDAISEAVTGLLDNDLKRYAVRRLSYEFGRKMIWPNVAQRYMETFQGVQEPVAEHPLLPVTPVVKAG